MKYDYEAPLAEVYRIQIEESLLSSSVETMRTVAGIWDEEDEG